MKKPSKKQLTKKREREYKLFVELQNKHGYTLRELSRGPKTAMVFNRDAKMLNPVLLMQLAVPEDSALGQAIKESRK